MQEILKAEGLKKYFGKVKAVDGVDFSVSQGGLVALLGQNGAGKSTTINIICTLLKKDAGCVRVCGADVDLQPDEVRANIGVVFQGSIMDRTLSVSDNLLLRAGFYGLNGTQARERLKNLDGMLDLKEIFSRQYGKLSGGQYSGAGFARRLEKPLFAGLRQAVCGALRRNGRFAQRLRSFLRKRLLSYSGCGQRAGKGFSQQI